MPDPRSQILLHQLGHLPAIARLPQLAKESVGRTTLRTGALGTRTAQAPPTRTLDTPETPQQTLNPASTGLLPRHSVSGGAMSIDERSNAGVAPEDLAERLRVIEGGSMGSIGTRTPDLSDLDVDMLDVASPSAGNGMLIGSPPASIPQTPGNTSPFTLADFGPMPMTTASTPRSVGSPMSLGTPPKTPPTRTAIIDKLAQQLREALDKGKPRRSAKRPLVATRPPSGRQRAVEPY